MAVHLKEINAFTPHDQTFRHTLMKNSLLTARTVSELRLQVDAWHQAGLKVGLVPTMGALHQGHLSLIDYSRANADRTIASIFVNPRQFGPGEDIERYPRDAAADMALLAAARCDLVYMPTAEAMYPQGFSTKITIAGMDDLCGAVRPGHFDGVATVVAKLLMQSKADIAVFGEKDFQQLTMIRQLVRDLDLDTGIIAAPLVRDTDGLALSSRNHYLTAAERLAALALPNALYTARQALLAGDEIAATLDLARASVLAGGFSKIDYVALRYDDGLAMVQSKQLLSGGMPIRLLAAAHIGTTRLIDTVVVTTA